MEGRLVPVGLRQEDQKRDAHDRDSIKLETRFAVVDAYRLQKGPSKAAERVSTGALILASVLAASLLRMGLQGFLKEDYPFATFTLAAILVSWRCGMVPGFLTGALGALVAIPLFTKLADWDQHPTASGITGLVVYLTTCFAISAICGSLRSARSQAERAAALAKERERRIEKEIEAREEAQDAARVANDKTQKLLESIAEAMIALDMDWNVLYANDNALALLKVEREDLCGHRLWDVLYASKRGGLWQRLKQVRESGLPSRFELSQGENKQWIEYRAYPTPDGITLFARDITEEKRTRTALEESEERYRAFLTQSSEAIWRFELDKPVSMELSPQEQIDAFYKHAYLAECNEVMARQYGYDSTKEIIGKRLGEILPRDDQRNLDYLCAFIHAGYRIDEAESFETDKDGLLHVFLNNLLGIQKDGYLLRAWGTQRDITRQKQAESEVRKLNTDLERRVEDRTLELRLANKELEAFCYSVSHDLRAPVRSMMAQSVILMEDYTDKLDEEGQRTLKRLAAASKNMGQLIDDLLHLSKIQRAEIRKEDVNISEICQGIAQELGFRGSNVAFQVQPDLKVVADRGLIRVALMNLLENASKFASKSESPRVEIGMCQLDGKPVYFVKDNGVGFDMKYVDKIFRPFERLHRAEDYPGTGIGLANVERVIERHGGRVWAEGALGVGATFYFTLGV